MYRAASPEDIPALISLEQAAFGDGEPMCRTLFTQFAGGVDHIFLAEEAGNIMAMALAVPVTLEKEKGVYLYALTTAEEHRGSGVMAGLLQFLRTQAAAGHDWRFLCLIPASEKLFAYYEKHGFVTEFYRRRYEVSIRRNLLATAEFDDITVTMLPTLREKLCRVPDIRLSATSLVSVLTDYYSEGGSSVRTDGAYGFYMQKGDTLYFDEFFALDAQAAERLLQACREHTGREKAVVLADTDSMGSYGSGERLAWGMLCTIGQPLHLREPYMGMLLEN